MVRLLLRGLVGAGGLGELVELAHDAHLLAPAAALVELIGHLVLGRGVELLQLAVIHAAAHQLVETKDMLI